MTHKLNPICSPKISLYSNLPARRKKLEKITSFAAFMMSRINFFAKSTTPTFALNAFLITLVIGLSNNNKTFLWPSGNSHFKSPDWTKIDKLSKNISRTIPM